MVGDKAGRLKLGPSNGERRAGMPCYAGVALRTCGNGVGASGPSHNYG